MTNTSAEGVDRRASGCFSSGPAEEGYYFMEPTVEHTARVSRERQRSWTAVKCPSWLKGRHPGHKTMLHRSMTSLNRRKPIGGAGNHRVVGNISGLAVWGCGAAGSGPSGESSKTK